MILSPRCKTIIDVILEKIIQAAQQKCVFICDCGFIFQSALLSRRFNELNDDINKFERGIIEYHCSKCGKILSLKCSNPQHIIVHNMPKEGIWTV